MNWGLGTPVLEGTAPGAHIELELVSLPTREARKPHNKMDGVLGRGFRRDWCKEWFKMLLD